MKTITIVLPEQTHQVLTEVAKSHGSGIALDQYCSVLLTEIAAQHGNGTRHDQLPHPHQNPSPSRQPILLSQNVLLREIIEFLKESGGSAEKPAVEDALLQKYREIFEQPYYSELVGGGVPRWKKNVQFARHTGRSFGLIKPPGESGRGYWELTDKGRGWTD